jgi:hypothetical protein
MGKLTVDFSKLHGAEAAWVRQQFADLCGRVGASVEDVEWFQPRSTDAVTGEPVYVALLILTWEEMEDDELSRLWEQVQAEHQSDERRGAGQRKKRRL